MTVSNFPACKLWKRSFIVVRSLSLLLTFSSNCHFLQGWTSHQQQNMLHASPLMGFLTSRTTHLIFFFSPLAFDCFFFPAYQLRFPSFEQWTFGGWKRVLVSFPRHSCTTSTRSQKPLEISGILEHRQEATKIYCIVESETRENKKLRGQEPSFAWPRLSVPNGTCNVRFRKEI
jgi:hypothetical protein